MSKRNKKKTSHSKVSPGSLEHKILKYFDEIEHKDISLKKVLKRFSKKYDDALIKEVFSKLESKGRITVTADKKVLTGRRNIDTR
jgi:DUF1009 family protein